MDDHDGSCENARRGCEKVERGAAAAAQGWQPEEARVPRRMAGVALEGREARGAVQEAVAAGVGGGRGRDGREANASESNLSTDC